MTKTERLNKAFNYLCYLGMVRSQKEFAELVNFNEANMSSALNGNTKYLTDNLLRKVSDVTGVFNPAWLLTGEGDMLLSQGTTQHVSGSNNTAVSGGNVVRIGNISGSAGEERGQETLKVENDLLRSENESLRRQNERLLEIVAAAMGAAK